MTAPLATNPDRSDSPERHRVGEHDRATRRHDSQSDDAEDEKPRYLKLADPEKGEALSRDGQQRSGQYGKDRGEDRYASRPPQRETKTIGSVSASASRIIGQLHAQVAIITAR